MAPSPPSRPARSLARRLARWTLQATLVGALLFQFRILADGGFRLPDFARAELDRLAAAEGLTFSADDIWLDPSGRVLVLRPRLGLADQDAPFASARAVGLQLRRRDLLSGVVRIDSVEVTDLSLALPPAASPTAAAQPLLEAGEFRLTPQPGSPVWRVDQASARLLGVPAAFTGTLPALARERAARRPPAEIVRDTLHQAANVYRHVANLPLADLRVLRVDLAPEELALNAEIARLETPAHPALPPSLVGAAFEQVRLRLTLPFSAPLRARPGEAELRLLAARIESPPGLALRGEDVALRLTPGPVLAADLAVARLEKTDRALPPVPLVVAARFSAKDQALEVELSTRLADTPWHARFAGSPTDKAGRLAAQGALSPALLDQIRPFLPPKARPVLELTDPVALDLSAELAPGGRPARVVARAAAGRAVAGKVRFDRAGAVLLYEPAARLLRADELLLVQDDSHAEGSYEMDTDTLAFRFLLGGRLRPMAIEGWFSGWWDRFWANFAFGETPPAAEVDIQGVWRRPESTTVYVGAASGPMRLREQDLDTLHTRVRVGWGSFDILGFRATQGPFVAAGGFSRLLGPDGAAWSRMRFDVRSDFPADTLPRIFPQEGPALIAPFTLRAAPRIHLVGETFGPASATPGAQRYDLELATFAPLTYSGFPLDHLSLRLERRDSDLLLHEIRAGFAGGLATGEARLSGPDRDRWLAFDLALADADLDLAQVRWKEFQASRPARLAPPTPTPTKAPAPGPAPDAATEAKENKPLGGRIDLSFAATGPLDDPLAYSGRGEAKIRGADLARIRLMGPFSSLLGELGLGFTTVRLTEADARLGLERERLVFDELRLTGPSALIEARGVYTLPEGALDFKAKVRPFEQRAGLLGSTADLVFSPLTHALEVELDGTLEAPTWTFSYGPTKLFRRLF